MRRQEEGDSSSNPESQDSEDSLEPSDCETDHKVGRLGGLHIKVERYGDGKVEELQDLPSSCSSEEEEDEVEDIIKDCNSGGELSGPAMSKHQKRKKRRKKQKWDGSRQRLRLSPSAADPQPWQPGPHAWRPASPPASTLPNQFLCAEDQDWDVRTYKLWQRQQHLELPTQQRDLPQRVPLQYDKTPRHLPFYPACRPAGVHPRLSPHSTWYRGWRRQQKTQLQWKQ